MFVLTNNFCDIEKIKININENKHDLLTHFL